jgi:hypothetical protein
MSWIRLNEGCTIRTTENARASCTLVGDIGIALGGVFWFMVWYIPICTCMYWAWTATLLQLQGITAFEVTRLSSYIQLSLYNPTIILASNVGQNFGVVTKFTFIACFSTERIRCLRDASLHARCVSPFLLPSLRLVGWLVRCKLSPEDIFILPCSSIPLFRRARKVPQGIGHEDLCF